MRAELRRQDRLCHDQSAHDYDERVTRGYGAYHLLGLGGWLQSHKSMRPGKALDEGTGTGVVALELARVCDEVVGLDHSMGMLEVARDKAAAGGGGGRVWFVRGDCHRLPFGDETFDIVTIQGMLHHHGSVDWECALRESARVLRVRGMLYISEPCRERNPVGQMLAAVLGGVIRVVRAIMQPGRVVKRLKGREAAEEGEEAVNAVEGRIRSGRVESALREMGFETRTRYLTEVPGAGELGPRWGARLVRVVSAPEGSRFGDIVFIYARKGERGTRR